VLMTKITKLKLQVVFQYGLHVVTNYSFFTFIIILYWTLLKAFSGKTVAAWTGPVLSIH